jgi:hypothetical protein
MFDSIKNPGFLTTIEERKKGDEKREIKILVSNLNNIKYIDTIGIYLDSLARLSITEDTGLLEKCNAVMAIEEPDANAEASEADANAEAIKEIVAKAQPVDINKLISRFEENDAIREVDSDNDDEIDLEDFLESDDEDEEVDGDEDEDADGEEKEEGEPQEEEAEKCQEGKEEEGEGRCCC